LQAAQAQAQAKDCKRANLANAAILKVTDNMNQLGWIDFSPTHRNKVMLVMDIIGNITID
jgi:hypothetical protein